MSTLLVSGFHRSGTSLACKILRAAGGNFVDLNNYNSLSNPDGHHENQKIVSLHENILKNNGSDWRVTDPIAFTVSKFDRDNMMNVVGVGGGEGTVHCHKDPRAVLFLNDWAKIDESIKFLLIYRDFSSCERSLMVREAREQALNVTSKTIINHFWSNDDMALRMWIEYNSRIISFVREYPNRTLLISHDSIMRGLSLPDAVNRKYGFCLKSIDPGIRCGYGVNQGNEFAEHSVEIRGECISLMSELHKISAHNVHALADIQDTIKNSSANHIYNRDVVSGAYELLLSGDIFFQLKNADSNSEAKVMKFDSTKSLESVHIGQLSELAETFDKTECNSENIQSWLKLSVLLGDVGCSELAIRARLLATKLNLVKKVNHIDMLLNSVESVSKDYQQKYADLTVEILEKLPKNIYSELAFLKSGISETVLRIRE